MTIRKVAAGGGEAAFDHVDAPAAPTGFEVELENDDWLEYAIEVPTPCTLDIEVELGPGGPDQTAPLALTLDGQPVATTPGDACVRATTPAAVPAGSHMLRVTGLASAVGIRALVVTPRRSGGPASGP